MKPQFAAHTPPKGSEQWHELKAHLRKVADRAKGFSGKLKASKLGYYAGLWHDLGKYNPKFQEYLQQCHTEKVSSTQKKRRGPNHAVYGAILANDICPLLAPIIYGHHAGLPDFDDLELEDAAEDSQWSDVYEQVLEFASQELQNLLPTEDLDQYLELWPDDDPLVEDVLTRLLFSCLIDADHLDTESHFEKENTENRENYPRETISALWSKFEIKQQELVRKSRQKNPNSEVNPIRQEIYEACFNAAMNKPRIFRLAVPTGGGKTISGLAFALKHIIENSDSLERVVVAVPYTSIIEQTVREYRKILGEDAVLEHHSAVKAEFVPGTRKKDFQTDEGFQVDEGAQRSQAQARLITQNWDAPLIVTTTVQLFESLFSNRPSKCRKLHNLVGSVIILDEVQTLPIQFLQPIVSMLQELVERYSVSVVLCTATQPALDSVSAYFKGFDAKLIHDIVEPGRSRELFGQLKRVEYDTTSIQNQDQWSWDRLATNLKSHTQALVVLNTRKDSLKVLDELGIVSTKSLSLETPESEVAEVIQESKVLHLSTLLCGAHRQTVLAEVRHRLDPENPKPCLLVSTQVVEAGVDLDFPRVYRALGPLDRLVQAAGRCNREGNRASSESQVVIFDPVDGSLPRKGSEYDKATRQTQTLLMDANFDFHNPDIFKGYFESLYQVESPDGKKIQDLREHHHYPRVAKEFKLIEDNSVPIVICYNDTVNELLREIGHRGLWSSDFRKLQPYIVNLPEWEFRKAQQGQIVLALKGSDSIFVLKEGAYHPIRGMPLGEDPNDWVYRDALVC
jgi:CRISPR-associated endonuclease/helicase Cas3